MEVLQEIEGEFEAAHPDVDVALAFGGSQVLRLQIASGAETDVFLSASRLHARSLVDSGHLVDIRPIAESGLAMAVPTDSTMRRFEELAGAQRVVLGVTASPIGTYSEALLAQAARSLGPSFREQVEAAVVSREANVRLTRAKIALGEADAAIVYRTDGSPEVRLVALPPSLEVPVKIVGGVHAESAQSTVAEAFLQYLTHRGQHTFLRHGFDPP